MNLVMEPWTIKGKKILVRIVQGGMGIRVSGPRLVEVVSDEGGVGTLSSAGLKKIASMETRREMSTYQAVCREIEITKKPGRYVAINIMHYLQRDFTDSVRASIDAGVDAIVCGAGLPMNLPSVYLPKDTALIPIVSSARALSLICQKWERQGYRPDAAVLEGPMAGGHLGFKFPEIFAPEYALEKLFSPVKDVAKKYGDFPVIVAGGLYTHKDLLKWIRKGASAGQFGTRFLATHESSASSQFKNALVECKEEDIIIADKTFNPPGSPCGLPFRILRQSPMFYESKFREPVCSEGYVLQKDKEGKFISCPAKENGEQCFCICCTLFSAVGLMNDFETWTTGQNGWRIKKILHAKEVMDRLKGLIPED